MSLTVRRIIGAAVVVLPFLYFVVLLMVSPSAAGSFAGSVLIRLVDPILFLDILVSGIAGAKARDGLLWAAGASITATLATWWAGYSWWVKVAGSDWAQQTAVRTAVWALAFALCGFLIGRAFYRPGLVKPTPSADESGHPNP